MQVTNSLTNTIYNKYQSGMMNNMSYMDFYQMIQSANPDGCYFTSPQMQLWVDYKNWKATQPPRNMPDTKGLTEENIAYLKEHFSGDLDLFHRVDALDTMVEMGIITQREMDRLIGFGPVELVSAGNVKMKCNGTPEEYRANEVASFTSDWSNFFQTAAVMQSDILDKLYELLDEQLKNAQEKDAAQEIKDVLEQVARKSFGAAWAVL